MSVSRLRTGSSASTSSSRFCASFEAHTFLRTRRTNGGGFSTCPLPPPAQTHSGPDPFHRSSPSRHEVRMTPRSICRFLCLALISATPALAQTGSIGGRITDSTTSAPVVGADVRAVSGTSVAGASIAGNDGAYRIANVPAGTYDIVVKYIGYAQRRIPGIRVAAGQNVQLDIRIAGTVTALNPTVISASRQSEKEMDAPA